MLSPAQSPYAPVITTSGNSISQASQASPSRIERIKLDIGYEVWTKRVGDGPIKVLMLHGGPGFSHLYLEPSFTANLLSDDYEIIYYDQLGSYNSDKPSGPEARHLWTVERFLSEVEEVIEKLQLDNFVIYGHSWGGLLGIEYALKHPKRLKGLIISSMTSNIDDYIDYAYKLRSELPQDIQDQLQAYEDRGEFENPEYEGLLFKELYTKHICRLNQWPEEAMQSMEHLNKEILNEIQGPNEFVYTGNTRNWNRTADLKNIATPTLVISGQYDTMNPEKMKEMAELIPNATGKICANGSHLTFFDDTENYFSTIKEFTSTL